jgi:anti-sigma factor RsiW
MSDHEHSNCQSLLGSLSEYVDGTLSQELCAEIEDHLSECQNCHLVVDTLRKTISLYRQSAAEAGEVPALVKERLFRVLNLDDYIRH